MKNSLIWPFVNEASHKSDRCNDYAGKKTNILTDIAFDSMYWNNININNQLVIQLLGWDRCKMDII